MCIKNGILRVLFSGHSFIDFQGVALSASPRENQPLPDVGFERVNIELLKHQHEPLVKMFQRQEILIYFGTVCRMSNLTEWLEHWSLVVTS